MATARAWSLPAITVQLRLGVHTRVAESFDSLFAQEYPRLVAIAYRMLGDRHAAEDVAQEVFLDFHRKHSADAEYAARWLHAAAAHAALNLLRGNRRRMRREAAHVAGWEDDRAVAAANHPELALEELERRREVRAALSRLPRRSGAVLVLRYSGLSYAEVAAALGVKVGAIGTMLRRAEAAFRKEVLRGSPD